MMNQTQINCLSAEQLDGYTNKEPFFVLPAAEKQAIKMHLLGCVKCRMLVEEWTRREEDAANTPPPSEEEFAKTLKKIKANLQPLFDQEKLISSDVGIPIVKEVNVAPPNKLELVFLWYKTYVVPKQFYAIKIVTLIAIVILAGKYFLTSQSNEPTTPTKSSDNTQSASKNGFDQSITKSPVQSKTDLQSSILHGSEQQPAKINSQSTQINNHNLKSNSRDDNQELLALNSSSRSGTDSQEKIDFYLELNGNAAEELEPIIRAEIENGHFLKRACKVVENPKQADFQLKGLANKDEYGVITISLRAQNTLDTIIPYKTIVVTNPSKLETSVTVEDIYNNENQLLHSHFLASASEALPLSNVNYHWLTASAPTVSLSNGVKQLVATTFKLIEIIKGGDNQQEPVPESQEIIKREADLAFKNAETLRVTGTPESYQQAIIMYDKARSLYHKLNDKEAKSLEADANGNTAHCYMMLGEYDKAIEFSNNSIQLRLMINDLDGEAAARTRIGICYTKKGNTKDALVEFDKALTIKRKLGNKLAEAVTLTTLGDLLNNIGEQFEAQKKLTEAYQIFKDNGQRLNEAKALSILGSVYDDVGDYGQAIYYYEEGKHICEELMKNAQGEEAEQARYGKAAFCNNLGLSHLSNKEYDQSIQDYNDALNLLPENSTIEKATIFNHIAGVNNQMGETQKALEYCTQARTLYSSKRFEIKELEAAIDHNFGHIYENLSQSAKSIDYYQKALKLRSEIPDEIGKASTNYGLARVEYGLSRVELKNQHLLKARDYIRSAIEGIELLRTKIVSEHESFDRAYYLAQKQEYYDFYINLLNELHKLYPDKGYDIEAFKMSENARARSLLDLLSTKDSGNNDPIDRDPLAFQREVRQALDNDTALLEYWVSKKHIYLWVITSKPEQPVKCYLIPTGDSFKGVIENVKNTLISPKNIIQRFKDKEIDQHQVEVELNNNLKNYQAAAEILSNTLFKDVLPLPGITRLVIVANKDLTSIPFAVLPMPQASETSEFMPILAKYEVVVEPSISTLILQRRKFAERQPAKKVLAVFADPISSTKDTRYHQLVHNESSNNMISRSELADRKELEPLPYSRSEGIEIAKLINDRGKKREFFDLNANIEAMINEDLRHYRIIHFAVHAKAQNILKTGLYLSGINRQGNEIAEFLNISAISKLDLPADLITLSACETASGEKLEGEGSISLGREFMSIGAARVISSLWSVNDQATQILMQRFYQNMLGPQKLSPSAALREAQLFMLKNKTIAFRSPYFWAAFVFQGEWTSFYPGI